MRRLTLGLMLALAASGTVGCTTCYTPYDHCVPTYTGAPGESCCEPRQGSILDGNYGAYGGYDVEYGPGEVIEEVPMPEATSEVPHETSARRTKLRPIPDRTTSRMRGPIMRR